MWAGRVVAVSDLCMLKPAALNCPRVGLSKGCPVTRTWPVAGTGPLLNYIIQMDRVLLSIHIPTCYACCVWFAFYISKSKWPKCLYWHTTYRTECQNRGNTTTAANARDFFTEFTGLASRKPVEINSALYSNTYQYSLNLLAHSLQCILSRILGTQYSCTELYA